MFKVILVMLSGIGVGYLLRGRNISIVSKITTISIYLLLLFLGISVGLNPEIMDNLHTIGLDGLIITIAALLGTMIAALFVYKKFFKEKPSTNNQQLTTKK